MARLESIARQGFYPTPIHLSGVIASYVAPSPGGWLLDPCCGEGDFAHALAQSWQLKSLGVEINRERAIQASKKLDRVIADDFFSVRGSHRQFRVCWNNPPYMYDEPGLRLETKFNQAMRYVASRGVYMWCVPSTILDRRVASSLSSALSNITVWRFPDEDYQAYKQTIVMGLIKSKPYKDNDESDRLVALFENLPVLYSQNNPLYELPVTPKGKFFFTGQFLDSDQMAREVNEFPFDEEMRDDFFFPEQQEKKISVMPFRHGHLLQLLAANIINNVELRKNGQHLIISGRTRYITQRTKDESNQSEWWDRDIEVTRPVMDLCILDMNTKKFTTYTNATPEEGQELAQIFEEWASELAQAVIDQFDFLYDFDFSKTMSLSQQRVLSQIGLGRVLPGRSQGGLLAGQLHAVAAAYQSLDLHKHVFFNAMMSFGKTICYTALMALEDHHYRNNGYTQPALYAFVTEPHLVEKMKREVEDFWTVYNGNRKLHSVPEVRVCETTGDISDLVQSAFEQRQKPHVAVMSRMRIKLSSGWQGVYREEKRLLSKTGAKNEPFCLRKCGSHRELLKQWRQGIHEKGERFSALSRLYERVAIPKQAWMDSNPSLFARHVKSDLFGVTLGRCPTCGSLIREDAAEPGALPAIIVDQEELDEHLNKVQRFCAAEIKDGNGKTRVCDAALWQDARLVGNGDYQPTYGDFVAKHDPSILVDKFMVAKPPPTRYPLADFIRNGAVTVDGKTIKLKDLFRLVAFDETHQYKSQDSAQGYAMGALVQAIDKSVLMTGTLTNGRADSIYYLMYRLISEIKQMYGYRDSREFARRFGVIEAKFKKPTPALIATGKYSGRPVWQKVGERIRPGMSPELIRYILARGFFVNLDDLGFQLQPRYDSHVEVHLEEYQQELYEQFYKDCKDAMKQARKDDIHLAGAYVHRILGYPNAMFRPHYLLDKDGAEWARAPGVEWKCRHCHETFGGPGWYCPKCHEDQDIETVQASCPDGCYEHTGLVLLPKEKWLVERIQRNIEDGRKTLVFCRQTDILDIIDRLMQVIRGVGASAARLPKGDSRKREGWLQQNTPKLDVLFCNPRSVETGLDMVEYSEAIFYEPEHRIYTCDQAAARVHRLTSPGPVDITWAVYQDTEEAAAVDSIVAGLTVAAMFSGDSYALAEYDDGDFIQSMVKRLQGKELTVVDLATRFANFRDKSAMMASLINRDAEFDIDTDYDVEGHEEKTLDDWWDDPGVKLKQLSLF